MRDCLLFRRLLLPESTVHIKIKFVYSSWGSLISLKTKRHKKLIKRWKKNLKVDLHSIHSNSFNPKKFAHSQILILYFFFANENMKTITQNKDSLAKLYKLSLNTAQAAKTAKAISIFSDVANIDQLSMKLGILPWKK